MLQQSNGTTSKHSLNGHVLINGKEHGSKSGVPWAAARGDAAVGVAGSKTG